jgi:hypothetical protein
MMESAPFEKIRGEGMRGWVGGVRTVGGGGGGEERDAKPEEGS